MEKKKLTGKEKFAYGLGAVGKDMVYMLSASYILYYYQDIMGISAWVMGIILMIARVFDAFNDPIMGVLVAKTKTRWGKFRPWLFMGTLTNAIVLFVMFACPPSLTGGGLVAYAAVFYILWGVTYTMMDIPYWSMVPAFTEGGKERENLSAMARTCAGVGSAIITVVTVMAVAFLGNLFTSHNASNETLNVKDNISAYVVELDAQQNPTGAMIELAGNHCLDITANQAEFQQAISYTGDNSNFEIQIGSAKYADEANEKTGTKAALMSYVMDEAKGEGVLTLYLSEKDYQEFMLGSNVEVTGTIASTKEVERVGFKWFSLIIAILFLAFTVVTCLCIKEKSTVTMETVGVKDMFRSLLQNDQAMAMVVTIVLVNTATYITSNLVIYFFKYDLGGENWAGNYTLFNTFGGAMQILAMMAFFPLLRKLFTTMKMFYVAAMSAILGYLVLLVLALAGVNTVGPFLVPCFFIMAAVGIINVLVTVFLANTVDYGELKNNRRDESVIFSMQTFVVKLASGIAALVASICLSVFNLSDSALTVSQVDGSLVKGAKALLADISTHAGDAAAGSSMNSVMGLRMVMTLIPILVLVVAILVFKKKYTLNDQKLAEISTQLATKKQQGE